MGEGRRSTGPASWVNGLWNQHTKSGEAGELGLVGLRTMYCLVIKRKRRKRLLPSVRIRSSGTLILLRTCVGSSQVYCRLLLPVVLVRHVATNFAMLIVVIQFSTQAWRTPTRPSSPFHRQPRVLPSMLCPPSRPRFPLETRLTLLSSLSMMVTVVRVSSDRTASLPHLFALTSRQNHVSR